MAQNNQRDKESHLELLPDVKSNSTALRIVIAESDPTIHQRLLKTIESMGRWFIYSCSEYPGLVQTLSSGTVDLLVLGNIEQGSCFEILHLCAQEWQNLAVVLVSHDPVIPDFCRHAISEIKGLAEVVSSDPTPANQSELIRIIQNVTGVISAQKQAQSLIFSPVNDMDSLVSLEIDGQLTTTPVGTNLLSVLLSNDIKVLKVCGGNGRCATCHVFVEQGMDVLSPPTDQERMTLSLMRIEPANARLACQCKVLGQGVAIQVPKGKYVDSEAELEALVGKKAQQSLIHPFTGEILVQEGKLILRSALEKMQELNQEFEKEMGVLLSSKFGD
jgi:ferredoxin